MLIRIVFLFSLLSLSLASDIEYIIGIEKPAQHSIKPSIDHAHFLKSLTAGSLSRTVLMTGHNGKKYECTIPSFDAPSIVSINQPNQLSHKQSAKQSTKQLSTSNQQTPALFNPFDASPSATKQVDKSVKTSIKPLVKPSVSRKSDPHESLGAVSGRIKKSFRINGRPTCLTHQVGYWNYQICPHRSIDQFHVEAGVKPAGPHGDYLSYQQSSKSSLGTFDQTHGDEWTFHSHDGTDENGEWIYSQHFTKGTDNRRSMVRFICPYSKYGNEITQQLSQYVDQFDRMNKQSTKPLSNSFIAHMTEPSTFYYEFDLVTPHACDKKTIDQANSPSLNQSDNQTINQTNNQSIDWSSFNSTDSDLSLALQLIAPLKDQCLMLMDGTWWSYQLCVFDGIVQFHREAAPMPVPGPGVTATLQQPVQVNVQEMDIGHFDPRAKKTHASSSIMPHQSYITSDLTNEQIINQTKLVRGFTFSDTWLSQRYTNGEPCDIKGVKRSTEVRFVCNQYNDSHKRGQAVLSRFFDQSNDQSNNQAALTKVDEPSTCEYRAIVAVPALCSHPLFAPKMPTVHDINCKEIEID